MWKTVLLTNVNYYTRMQLCLSDCPTVHNRDNYNISQPNWLKLGG